MKTFTLFSFFASCVLSQCGNPNEWVYITQQSELESISECTEIRGSLSITGEPVTDLSPLRNLRSVELSLDITTTGLESLNGLSSLTTVSDKLFIHSNSKMTSLDGLVVTTVTGGILVYDSPELKSIAALETLTTINDQQSIQYPFGVSIYNNPKLATLKGLGNLRSFGNLLRISQNPKMESLAGLPASDNTLRNLTLFDNEKMNDITALRPYKSASSKPTDIEIRSMNALTALEGLEGITSIGNLLIIKNGRLSNIASLASATIEGPRVDISDNGLLCDFSGVNVTAARVPGANVPYDCGSGFIAGEPSALSAPALYTTLVASITALFL